MRAPWSRCVNVLVGADGVCVVFIQLSYIYIFECIFINILHSIVFKILFILYTSVGNLYYYNYV